MSLPICPAILVLATATTLHPIRLASTIDYYGSRADRADFEIHHCFGISNGVFYVQRVRRGNVVDGIAVKAVAGYPAEYPPARTLFGFAFIWQNAAGWKFREVDFPIWPFALTGAVTPMRAYQRRRRLKRIGLCRGCGYDLTGNISGVCPECGTLSNFCLSY